MIYLDNAATSWPKPPAVAGAVLAALTEWVGNPGRTSHHSAMEIADSVHDCRENLAQLFGISNPLRICFTANTTDALNLAIKGALSPGDHVICSSMEHNSVWRPLIALQKQGVELSIAEADERGVVNAEDVKQLVRNNTKLIAIIHASNVNGAIQPVAEIGSFARASGVVMLVDAAQSAGSLPIDAEDMCIDLLAFPGHKGLLGPQGTGGLYVRDGIELTPLKHGGTGSESNSPYQPSYYPDHLESGTLNVPGIAGLNAGVRYLLKIGPAKIAKWEGELTRRLLAGLAMIEEVTIYGPTAGSPRAPVVSFNIRGWDPAHIAEELEKRADIACRPGWHCAGLAHRTQGTQEIGTVRLSPGPFTKMSEVDTALHVIEDIARGR